MAGESLDALFGRRIARPLGMNLEWGRWLIGDLRVNGGAGNHFGMVQTSCLDICKLGELYRLGGVWAGERLLSRDWCTLATSVQARADLALHGTLFDGRGRYGLFWWVNGIGPAGDRKWKGVEPGAFSASGYNNNDLFVLPQAGIVACRLGTDQDFDGAVTDEIYAELLRDIVAAGNGSRGGTADG